MAEGGINPETQTEDDLLCCSVCLEEYEDPRALPCLHTFCYKCLIKLSTERSDSASARKASDQKLSSYITNLLNRMDKQNIVQCPLCQEVHPIPRDKGVAGFRKDFRIHKIIEQQKMEKLVKETVDEADKKSSDPKRCPVHLEEKLLYHCENAMCKIDICEQCWITDHDKHNVILLSKKVKDAKDELEKELREINSQVSFQIEILTQNEKAMKKKFATIENGLKQRLEEAQKKLKELSEKSFADLQSQRQIQEQKMSDKIESLRSLQNAFKEMQNDLDDEVRMKTSDTSNEYQLLSGQMKQLHKDLDEWSYVYTSPSLDKCKIGKVIQDAMNVTFEEVHLGTLPTKSKSSQKPARDQKEQVVKEVSGKSSEKSIEKTKKTTKQKETAGSEEKKEVTKEKESATKVEEIVKLKLEASFRGKEEIKSLDAAEDDTLYITTKNHFTFYHTSTRGVMKISENDFNGSAGPTAMSTSLADDKKFIVQLNSQNRMMQFSCLSSVLSSYSGGSKLAYPLDKDYNNLLASAGNFIAYPFNENDKVFVRCRSLNNASPPSVSNIANPIQVPFDSGKVRAICLYKSSKGTPVIFCSNYFSPGKSNKSEMALLAITVAKNVSFSKWTFVQLDSKATQFDLCSIACDSDSIFVLNTKGNVLYNVAKTGKSVKKVNVIGTNFLFSSVSHICLEAKSSSLYAVSDKDLVTKFTYDKAK